MYINLESKDHHTIEAYSDHEIRINSLVYSQNLIISSTEIITDWPIKTIVQLTEERLSPLLGQHPTIILIGHNETTLFAPPATRENLAKQNIALECMRIGPACRTFNVLLSERRNVVLGIIF